MDARVKPGHDAVRVASERPISVGCLTEQFAQASQRVMAGPVPAIHALLWRSGVDARDKRGHDGGDWRDV
jgi:hypothetical protein